MIAKLLQAYDNFKKQEDEYVGILQQILVSLCFLRNHHLYENYSVCVCVCPQSYLGSE